MRVFIIFYIVHDEFGRLRQGNLAFQASSFPSHKGMLESLQKMEPKLSRTQITGITEVSDADAKRWNGE